MFTILTELDDDSLNLTEKNIEYFNSLIGSPIIANNLHEQTIDIVDANRYPGDLYGLFHNVLKIPNEAFYINMIINDYPDSTAYNCETKFLLLNPDVFEKIIYFT